MITTTTHGIDGRRIADYLGIASGEAIVGANIFRDLFASIRDIVGGRAAAYEKVLGDAKTMALEQMTEQAVAWGADDGRGQRYVRSWLSVSIWTTRSSATGARCWKRPSAWRGRPRARHVFPQQAPPSGRPRCDGS